MDEKIGEKIKKLRKEKGLTLKDISSITTLSISFLSQLERSKCSVTLESLKKISEALDVNPSYFFSKPDPTNQSLIIRNSSVNDTLVENNFVYRDLTGNISNPLFSPVLVILKPGENRGNDFSHKGQEFLYVLEGSLTILIEKEEYILNPSDCIFLDSTKSHYWLNKSNEPTKLLCVLATR